MVNLSGFFSNRTPIAFDLTNYVEFLQKICESVSNSDILIAEDLLFYSNMPFTFDPSRVITYDELASLGIGIFDYLLFAEVKKNKSLANLCVWKIAKEKLELQPEKFPKAVFSVFFLAATRNKMTLDANETWPKFLKSYARIKMTNEEVINHLTRNDLSKISIKWIKSVRWSGFSRACVSRLLSGIAGTRYFNAIYQNQPTKKNISENLIKLHSYICEIARNGPYWTQHPMFYPEELRGISILKNLKNLMNELYDYESLNKMKVNQLIHDIPVTDERYTQYKSWGDDFRALFKDEDRVINVSFGNIKDDENNEERKNNQKVKNKNIIKSKKSSANNEDDQNDADRI